MSYSKFILIKCPRCNKRHVIFGKASTWVKCKSCNKLLIRPKGGKAQVKANIRTILPNIKMPKLSDINPFQKTQEKNDKQNRRE